VRSLLRHLPGRRAAVAIVQHDGELLLIERASRKGDRWSGHMAFPGGMAEAEDDDSRATAQRETREEVGLDLAQARYVRAQPQVLSVSHNSRRPLAIEPHLYQMSGARPDLSGNEEVASTLWLPVSFLKDPTNRDTMVYERSRLPMRFACYRYEGKVVWGLTLRMIDDLLAT
jgi:8-oxo-dGTP pyrophosphatase MutT (NUDIX family)